MALCISEVLCYFIKGWLALASKGLVEKKYIVPEQGKAEKKSRWENLHVNFTKGLSHQELSTYFYYVFLLVIHGDHMR